MYVRWDQIKARLVLSREKPPPGSVETSIRLCLTFATLKAEAMSIRCIQRRRLGCKCFTCALMEKPLAASRITSVGISQQFVTFERNVRFWAVMYQDCDMSNSPKQTGMMYTPKQTPTYSLLPVLWWFAILEGLGCIGPTVCHAQLWTTCFWQARGAQRSLVHLAGQQDPRAPASTRPPWRWFYPGQAISSHQCTRVLSDSTSVPACVSL